MAVTKLAIVLCVVAALGLYQAGQANSHILDFEEVHSRANLVVGSPGPSDVLLYRTNATKNAIVGSSQSQDVVYRGFNVNITYITAIETGITQNASAFLVAGGLRQSNATIRLTSAVSRGYNYTVSIWGK